MITYRGHIVKEGLVEKGDIERALLGATLFCVYFNARGADWGNTVTNTQGIVLENALTAAVYTA